MIILERKKISYEVSDKVYKECREAMNGCCCCYCFSKLPMNIETNTRNYLHYTHTHYSALIDKLS